MSLFDLMPQRIETADGGQFLYEEKPGMDKKARGSYTQTGNPAQNATLLKEEAFNASQNIPLLKEVAFNNDKTALLVKEGAEIGWIGKAN
jgi:hypothetical protein